MRRPSRSARLFLCAFPRRRGLLLMRCLELEGLGNRGSSRDLFDPTRAAVAVQSEGAVPAVRGTPGQPISQASGPVCSFALGLPDLVCRQTGKLAKMVLGKWTETHRIRFPTLDSQL